MSSQDYWKANLKLLSVLLFVWFVISFGFGIIFSDFLDQFSLGGFKLGFWFAQQGKYLWLCDSYFCLCHCHASFRKENRD